VGRPLPLDGLGAEPTGDPYEFFAVQKINFAKKRSPETKRAEADKCSVIYNLADHTFRDSGGCLSICAGFAIGDRVAHRPLPGQTDSASGIINDPNDWSRQVGDPRYIIDLFATIVTVSLGTMQIVDAHPTLAIREQQGGA
jgi:predicted helicase